MSDSPSHDDALYCRLAVAATTGFTHPDARFYQLILNKLPPNANVHFVNADNKQTVPKIATMYKQMGVRTAGIVDFDVLNNANEFSKQVEALDLAPETSARLNQLQSALAKTVTGQSVNSRTHQVSADLTAILSRLNSALIETDESVFAHFVQTQPQYTCRTAVGKHSPPVSRGTAVPMMIVNKARSVIKAAL